MYFFLDEQILQSRLTSVAGGLGKDYMATLTAIETTKPQVLSGQDGAVYGGAVGQMFQIFADTSVDIDEGDMLKDSQNRLYKVHSVSLIDEGVFPFQKVIIIREKE